MTPMMHAKQKIEDALSALSTIENTAKQGGEIHQIDIDEIRHSLYEITTFIDQDKIDRREGPVISKNADGIIACISWQVEDEIVDVIAQSDGYPAIKEREQQALETIQNLMGAFDNPIVRRKCRSEFTDQAIAEGRRYLETHTPDDDDNENPLEGLKDV